MVEELIKKAGTYPTKAELRRKLPKKIMYQTLLVILDYLEESNKIHIDRKTGEIVWIWDPQGVKRLKEKGLLAR
ncbi:hypothetical protein GF412_00280 [Candidatus Micrarchaeota archaeon]|nr:hypothetical protein [Candidatus Micrarchaeota archaeon]MBD3417412.1 hypothetical protein [Candidatus Micrarchaeota archaeon]